MQRTDLFYAAAELQDDDRHDPRDIERPDHRCPACGSFWCPRSCSEGVAWLEGQRAAEAAVWAARDAAMAETEATA